MIFAIVCLTAFAIGYLTSQLLGLHSVDEMLDRVEDNLDKTEELQVSALRSMERWYIMYEENKDHPLVQSSFTEADHVAWGKLKQQIDEQYELRGWPAPKGKKPI